MKHFVISAVALTLPGISAAQQRPAAAKSKPAAAKAKRAAAKVPAEVKPGSAAQAGTGSAGTRNVVLTVAGEEITAEEYDTLLQSLPEQMRAQAQGPNKRQVAEQIIRVKLLAAEARKRGLDKEKLTQARIAFATENLLAGAVFNEMMQKTSADEATLRKRYEAQKGQYESAEARHILVKFKGSPVPQREGKPELSEEEALAKTQDLRKRLLGGEDFAKLAKEESDDAGSGAAGGTLGSFGRGQMVGPFEEAAFKLPIGQVSEPIKTQFGYHLIIVDKRENKTFDEVRTQLAEQAKPEAARQSVEDLRKTATVVLNETYFGAEVKPPVSGAPATPAAPPVPSPAK